MRAGIIICFLFIGSLFTAETVWSETTDGTVPVCDCSDPSGIELTYTFLNSEDLRYSEEYLWVAYTCQKKIDPEDGRTKLFIGTGLAYEDNPAYDLPFQTETEEEIFYRGAWYTYENFSQKVRADDECVIPLS